jgi:hypothetical protein
MASRPPGAGAGSLDSGRESESNGLTNKVRRAACCSAMRKRVNLRLRLAHELLAGRHRTTNKLLKILVAGCSNKMRRGERKIYELRLTHSTLQRSI